MNSKNIPPSQSNHAVTICNKCGNPIPDSSKYCSFCGKKIIANHSSKKIKEGYFLLMALLVFLAMLVYAIITANIYSAIMATISSVAIFLAILSNKHIITVISPKLKLLLIIIAFILAIPYTIVFETKPRHAKEIVWDEIILKEVVPKPSATLAKTIKNSNQELRISFYKIDSSDFYNYVSNCKAKGFTYDLSQNSKSFSAYNKQGYELKLTYIKQDKQMDIQLNGPEKLDILVWPNNDTTDQLPVPQATNGLIKKNDQNSFIALVGTITHEQYQNYVKECRDRGFTINQNASNTVFIAKNNAGYELKLQYFYNDRMKITLNVPQYKVKVRVNCDENIIFSKYDIDVYFDDIFQNTIEHGKSDTYTFSLKRGSYVIEFKNQDNHQVDGKFTINADDNKTYDLNVTCHRSQITIENESK